MTSTTLVERLRLAARKAFARSPDADDWFEGDMCTQSANRLEALEQIQAELVEAATFARRYFANIEVSRRLPEQQKALNLLADALAKLEAQS